MSVCVEQLCCLFNCDCNERHNGIEIMTSQSRVQFESEIEIVVVAGSFALGRRRVAAKIKFV